MILVAIFVLCLASLASASCPPAAFDSFSNLSLSQFISDAWYAQKQIPLAYQPISDAYCVRALYVPFNASDLNEGLHVYNYANRLKVNGRAMGSGILGENSSVFQMAAVPSSQVFPRNRSLGGKASIDNPLTAASKLIVGPERNVLNAAKGHSLFNTLDRSLGPYWIVYVGGNYDWAIISGGPPLFKGKNGTCTTVNSNLPSRVQYRGGLWIFTRLPVDPISTALALAKMQSLGLDISQLVDVEQMGCSYSGSVQN